MPSISPCSRKLVSSSLPLGHETGANARDCRLEQLQEELKCTMRSMLDEHHDLTTALLAS